MHVQELSKRIERIVSDARRIAFAIGELILFLIFLFDIVRRAMGF